MPARKVNRSQRTLWYHEESESYVECYNEGDAQRCADQALTEVTGNRRHEANHIDAQAARLEAALEEIAQLVEEKALRRAGERLLTYLKGEDTQRVRKVR